MENETKMRNQSRKHKSHSFINCIHKSILHQIMDNDQPRGRGRAQGRASSTLASNSYRRRSTSNATLGSLPPPASGSASQQTTPRPSTSRASSSKSDTSDGPPADKTSPAPRDGFPTVKRKSAPAGSHKTSTTTTAAASSSSSTSHCPPSCTTCSLVTSLQSLNVNFQHVVPHVSSTSSAASAALPVLIWDLNRRNGSVLFDTEIDGSRSWESLDNFPPETLDKYKEHCHVEATELGMTNDQFATAMILLQLQKESLQEIMMMWKGNPLGPIEENFVAYRSLKKFDCYKLEYNITPFDSESVNVATNPVQEDSDRIPPLVEVHQSTSAVNVSSNNKNSSPAQSEEEEDDVDEIFEEDPENIDPVLVPGHTVFQVVDNNIQVGVFTYQFRTGRANRNHALYVCTKAETPDKNPTRCTFKIKTSNSALDENGLIWCTYRETVNANHLEQCREKHIEKSSKKQAVESLIAERTRNNAPDLEPRVLGNHAYHLGYRYYLMSTSPSTNTRGFRCSTCNAFFRLNLSTNAYISLSYVHKENCLQDNILVETKVANLKDYSPENYKFESDINDDVQCMNWLIRAHDEIIHCSHIKGSVRCSFGKPNIAEIRRLITLNFPPHHRFCTITNKFLSSTIWAEKRKRLAEFELKKWECHPQKLQKLVELIMQDDNIFIDWKLIAQTLEETSVQCCSYGFSGYLSKTHPDLLKQISAVMVEKIFAASTASNSIGLTLSQIVSSLQTAINPNDTEQVLLPSIVKHLLCKFTGARKRLNFLQESLSFIWNVNYKSAGNADWHKGISDTLKLTVNSIITQLKVKAKDEKLSYDKLLIVHHQEPDTYYLSKITPQDLIGQQVQVELETEDDGIIGDVLLQSATGNMKTTLNFMQDRGEIQYEGVDVKDSISVSEMLMKDEKLKNKIFQFGYYMMKKEGKQDRLVFVFTCTGSLHHSVAANLQEMLRGSGCYSIYTAYAIEGYMPDLSSFKVLALVRGIKAAYACKWLCNLMVVNRNNYRECAIGTFSTGMLLFFVKRLHAAGAIFNDSTQDWLTHNDVIKALSRDKIILNFTHRQLLNNYNIAYMKTFKKHQSEF